MSSEGSRLLRQYRALRGAAQDARLSRGDVGVMAVIVDHLGDGLSCFVGYARVAELAQVERRAVSRAIKRLCDFGYLRVESGGIRDGKRLANRYFLGEPTRDKSVPSDNLDASDKSDASDIPGAALGTNSSTALGTDSSPQPALLNPPLEPSAARPMASLWDQAVELLVTQGQSVANARKLLGSLLRERRDDADVVLAEALKTKPVNAAGFFANAARAGSTRFPSRIRKDGKLARDGRSVDELAQSMKAAELEFTGGAR